MFCIGIMKHRNALCPCFRAGFIHLINELIRQAGILIVLVTVTVSNHSHILVLETGLPTHPIKLRDCATCRKQYCADILCVGLKEKTGWNLLSFHGMFFYLYRINDELALIVIVMIMPYPVKIVH